jgi:hypothetical protein
MGRGVLWLVSIFALFPDRWIAVADQYELRTAAIAANLAKGMDVPSAVRGGCRYVQAGIRSAPGLGGGNGPLNHFHSVYSLPFAPYDITSSPSTVGNVLTDTYLGGISSNTCLSDLTWLRFGTDSLTIPSCWRWVMGRSRSSRSRDISSRTICILWVY